MPDTYWGVEHIVVVSAASPTPTLKSSPPTAFVVVGKCRLLVVPSTLLATNQHFAVRRPPSWTAYRPATEAALAATIDSK